MSQLCLVVGSQITFKISSRRRRRWRHEPGYRLWGTGQREGGCEGGHGTDEGNEAAVCRRMLRRRDVCGKIVRGVVWKTTTCTAGRDMKKMWDAVQMLGVSYSDREDAHVGCVPGDGSPLTLG